MEITGYGLRVNQKIDSQGIFLISNDNAQEAKIKTLIENLPDKLIFTVPDTLNVGTYRLEVRVDIGKDHEDFSVE